MFQALRSTYLSPILSSIHLGQPLGHFNVATVGIISGTRNLHQHRHEVPTNTFFKHFNEANRKDFVIREYSTGLSRTDDEGLFSRLRRQLGFAKTKTSKMTLRACGQLLFVKVADHANYTTFFEICNMEDTFTSWFVVMELHVWLLSCRLMEEGEDGRVARNALLASMWQDVDMRSKKLEGALPSARKLQVNELGQQFNTQLMSYDEGLLSSDHVLAGALWRRFFEHSYTNKQELLKQIQAVELLVAFTRCQFAKLHGLPKNDILKSKFKWVPFNKSLLELQPR